MDLQEDARRIVEFKNFTYNIYIRGILLLLMPFSHAQISYETTWKTNLPAGNYDARTLFSDDGNKNAHWPFPRGNRLAKFST